MLHLSLTAAKQRKGWAVTLTIKKFFHTFVTSYVLAFGHCSLSCHFTPLKRDWPYPTANCPTESFFPFSTEPSTCRFSKPEKPVFWSSSVLCEYPLFFLWTHSLITLPSNTPCGNEFHHRVICCGRGKKNNQPTNNNKKNPSCFLKPAEEF